MISASRMTAVAIHSDQDLVHVNHAVCNLVKRLGFDVADVTRIARAASHLARNILDHAGRGRMVCRHLHHGNQVGVELEFSDAGPGIADTTRAMSIGYSTIGRPGLGLPSASVAMDDVRIRTRPGRGTCVVARKWRSK